MKTTVFIWFLLLLNQCSAYWRFNSSELIADFFQFTLVKVGNDRLNREKSLVASLIKGCLITRSAWNLELQIWNKNMRLRLRSKPTWQRKVLTNPELFKNHIHGDLDTSRHAKGTSQCHPAQVFSLFFLTTIVYSCLAWEQRNKREHHELGNSSHIETRIGFNNIRQRPDWSLSLFLFFQLESRRVSRPPFQSICMSHWLLGCSYAVLLQARMKSSR